MTTTPAPAAPEPMPTYGLDEAVTDLLDISVLAIRAAQFARAGIHSALRERLGDVLSRAGDIAEMLGVPAACGPERETRESAPPAPAPQGRIAGQVAALRAAARLVEIVGETANLSVSSDRRGLRADVNYGRPTFDYLHALRTLGARLGCRPVDAYAPDDDPRWIRPEITVMVDGVPAKIGMQIAVETYPELAKAALAWIAEAGAES